MQAPTVTVLPAHESSHLAHLTIPVGQASLLISQVQDGECNGTMLWLGGQTLAYYFAHALARPQASRPRPRAVELGSGTGLTALALATLGYDVLATDVPLVCNKVLQSNIATNRPNLPDGSGSIQCIHLDWLDDPPHRLASPFGERVDVLFTTDTLYISELVTPLWRTLSSLARAYTPPPDIYVCLERRDSALLDQALEEAHTVWQFAVQRVPHKKVAKAIARSGVGWEPHDWRGVEIYKLSPLPAHEQQQPSGTAGS